MGRNRFVAGLTGAFGFMASRVGRLFGFRGDRDKRGRHSVSRDMAWMEPNPPSGRVSTKTMPHNWWLARRKRNKVAKFARRRNRGQRRSQN